MTLLRATRTAASRPEPTSPTSRATGSAPSAAPARRTSPPTRTRTAPVAATEPARAGSGPGRSRRRRPALLEVLVALSVGYWFGGRMADRRPRLGDLCRLVLLAAVLLGVVPLVAHPFLTLS